MKFSRKQINLRSLILKFKKEKIIFNRSYQKELIWQEKDRIRLIETILLNLIIPEVFFYVSKNITNIIDGEQRITSIIHFIENKFQLENKYLLSDKIKKIYGGKYFIELAKEDRNKILDYNISVVNITHLVNKKELGNMFSRLNLTNYISNDIYNKSKFGMASLSLSLNDFWKKIKIFSYIDIKKMKDVEYCSSIYVLSKNGVVNKYDNIYFYHEKYRDYFDEDGKLFSKIDKAITIINKLLNKNTHLFISKKSNVYTLFSVIFKMIDKKIKYDNNIFEKFELFVICYNRLKNNPNIIFSKNEEYLKSIFKKIKNYKEASLKFVDSFNNRMIRFEELYKLIIESNNDIKDIFKLIDKKLYNQIVYIDKANQISKDIDFIKIADVKIPIRITYTPKSMNGNYIIPTVEPLNNNIYNINIDNMSKFKLDRKILIGNHM